MEATFKLSREALNAFKAIYRDEFGDHISDGEAEEMGIRLLRLFDILSRPAAGTAEGGPSTLTYERSVR